MLELVNIRKSYESIEALKDVSISVQKGSIYGLIGSNGAGKTTLLKIITGIYKPDSGSALVGGRPVYENPAAKEQMMFISDSLYFFPQYNAYDMAKFYAGIYPSYDLDRYKLLMTSFGIDQKKRISTFSKGLKKQIGIILALSAMPEVLVLDEPLDGLDPVARKKIKNLIIQDVANRQMTVLISSHNLRELEDFCDTIGILHKGTLLVQKELDDIKTDIHKIQIAFKHEPPEGELFGSGSVMFEEKRGSVFLYIIRGRKEELLSDVARFSPAILDILPLTLEEIFIYEMGEIGYEIKNDIF